jgi:hypothetical protein
LRGNPRIAALLGPALLLVTFGAKELWRDHLKDQQDTLTTAENAFIFLRRTESITDELANVRNLIISKDPANQVRDTLIEVVSDSEASVDAGIASLSRLLEASPSHESEATLNSIRKDLKAVEAKKNALITDYLHQGKPIPQNSNLLYDAAMLNERIRIASDNELNRITRLRKDVELQYFWSTMIFYVVGTIAVIATVIGQHYHIEGLKAMP